MSRISVPISGKRGPIHEGHVELIKYAQSFGDVTVRIISKLQVVTSHILEGSITEQDEDFTEMINSIEALGVKAEVFEHPLVPDEERAQLLPIVKEWIEFYRPSLICERYCAFATVALFNLLRRVQPGEVVAKFDKDIRGPEVLSFFMRSVSKLFGRKERVIMPTMVKDSSLGIRHQSSITNLPQKFRPELSNLKSIVADFKPKMRKGKNLKIVEQINDSLKDKEWKVFEAIVFERGIMEGRLEMMSFSFPGEQGGTMLVEEIDYHV